MIYTITFNPSLDYLMFVDNFEIGQTNRSSKEQIYPGGKGFNVSTILWRLQVPTTALGFIAGFTGQEIEKQLSLRGFNLDLCKLDQGMSRINVKMKNSEETEINGSGPEIPASKITELFNKLEQLKQGDILVLAGSIPNSLPDDIYEQIMKQLEDKKILIIVDATNNLLRKVLPYHPFLIKPNLHELEELFATKITSQKQIIEYGKQLQQLGASNVLISLGKDGAILIAENNTVYACPGAKGKLINSVGSGDSMVAGFIAGYLVNHDYANALKLGSACGGATAFSSDLAQKELIEEIEQQLTVTVISGS
ncbi:1-phosphofructokinase [Thomasclavelia sp.]|uniref:1-phosphofructokinase n=1 Tax=Thomasclavelia sp. TaxID=3025757 RepID=UPI0025DC5C86|nr:1-phosphofructokinase [Thomasclavelia sp.]